MRVIVFVKADQQSEAGELPSEEMLAEMGRYNEELVNAGVMVDGEGLHPSSRGAKVKFANQQVTVIDGPFTEAKEIVAGYWVWQVKSMDEAVEWLRRSPFVNAPEAEVEIRPILEAEDFGEAYTPEIREQEDRIRAKVAESKQH